MQTKITLPPGSTLLVETTVSHAPQTSGTKMAYGEMVAQFNAAMGEVYPKASEMTPQERHDLIHLKYKLIEDERRELMKHYIEMMNGILLAQIPKKGLEDEAPQFSEESWRKYMVQFVDDLADIIYTCVHMALCLGLDIDGAFRAVHENNMTKCDPETGKVIKADGSQKDSDGHPYPVGKVLKPASYKPVDLSGFIP